MLPGGCWRPRPSLGCVDTLLCTHLFLGNVHWLGLSALVYNIRTEAERILYTRKRKVSGTRWQSGEAAVSPPAPPSTNATSQTKFPKKSPPDIGMGLRLLIRNSAETLEAYLCRRRVRTSAELAGNSRKVVGCPGRPFSPESFKMSSSMSTLRHLASSSFHRLPVSIPISR